MHNILTPGFQHKVTVSFFPMSFSAESHTHHTGDGLINGISVQMVCILHSGQAYCYTALGPISLAMSTEYVDESQCQEMQCIHSQTTEDSRTQEETIKCFFLFLYFIECLLRVYLNMPKY